MCQPGYHSATTTVVHAADYYPFGMVMHEREFNTDGYRYGFNGKEKDTEWDNGESGNVYDYGFRIYNPAIGKFLSVDPLAPKFPGLSVYQFAGNGPIRYVDMDGLELHDPGKVQGEDQISINRSTGSPHNWIWSGSTWQQGVQVTTVQARSLISFGSEEYLVVRFNAYVESLIGGYTLTPNRENAYALRNAPYTISDVYERALNRYKAASYPLQDMATMENLPDKFLAESIEYHILNSEQWAHDLETANWLYYYHTSKSEEGLVSFDLTDLVFPVKLATISTSKLALSSAKLLKSSPSFGVGAARKGFIAVANTTKGRLKMASLPITGKLRFVLDKNWRPTQPLQRGQQHGYKDRFDNKWVWDPKGQHWDVQLGTGATPNSRNLSNSGKHVNVTKDGRLHH